MADTPTLRADSEGRIQIVLPNRRAPASTRLSYILYGSPQAPAVVLRLALPGRSLYLLANPLQDAHRVALRRLAGQPVVRVVNSGGELLTSIFQPDGVRQNLARILANMPAIPPYPSPEWQKTAAEVQRRLPAAAEIPAILEGVKTGEMDDSG